MSPAAWLIFDVRQKMKTKTTLYFLLLGGCVALVVLWAGALSDGVRATEVSTAIVTTGILCVGSSAIAKKKIGEDWRSNTGDLSSAALMIAVAPAVIGFCVLVW